MTKREFCAVLGIGAGAALARPVTAWADRIRILGGGPDPAGPIEAGQVSPEWRKLLAGVRVGARRGHGALLISERERASVPCPAPRGGDPARRQAEPRRDRGHPPAAPLRPGGP